MGVWGRMEFSMYEWFIFQMGLRATVEIALLFVREWKNHFRKFVSLKLSIIDSGPHLIKVNSLSLSLLFFS